MPNSETAKLGRQYRPIKPVQGKEKEEWANEQKIWPRKIAARTVNKQRDQQDEIGTSSRT